MLQQQQQQQQQQPQRAAPRLFSNLEVAGIPSCLAAEGYNISPPLSNHCICLLALSNLAVNVISIAFSHWHFNSLYNQFIRLI
jgi:hypothetical protein